MTTLRKTLVAACVWLCVGAVFSQAKEAAVKQDDNVSVQQTKEWQSAKDEDAKKVVIGSRERLRIIPGNIILKARIDTGAETTSVGATDLQIVKEDGVDWAIFKIEETEFKQKVVEYTRIKRHGTVSTKRAVVKLRLILGNVSQVINVTLADREKFDYQLLIGRNMLYDRFVVDVSKKYTSEPMEYKE